MINNEEKQYLDLIKKVLDQGDKQDTRNATTFSLFGEQLKFNCRDYTLPLLTTKRVFYRGVVEELLWFLNGSTDANVLKEKGVSIWDKNSNREFLDSIMLNHYKEGDCGPIYGYQWRNWNGKYHNCGGLNEKGIDQLGNIIHLIKTDPYSRRMYMSAWNPEQLDQMCLPPCHVSYQFYVNSNDELSVHMYQRSADLFLGLPFNIASTATLLFILCKECNKKPGDVVISIGNIHLYENHIDAVRQQLENEMNAFPKLDINYTSIDELQYSDFTLLDYKCSKTIKAQMVA